MPSPSTAPKAPARVEFEMTALLAHANLAPSLCRVPVVTPEEDRTQSRGL